MEFIVRKEEIENGLKVIKDSKALTKSMDDGVSSLLIEVDKESQTLKLISSNYHVWCIIDINKDMFKSYEDEGISYEDFFLINESGSVFVDGNEFINVILGYPQSAVIKFTSEQKDSSVSTFYLEAFTETKRGKKIRNSFLIRTPQFFEKDPPQEDNKKVTISTEKIVKAVNAVEFVSGTNEKFKHLWGVQVEINNSNITAMSTDKKRICYFNPKVEGEYNPEDTITFTPIKSPLVSALKSLDNNKDVDIYIGERKTILKQEWQMHVLPNVLFTEDQTLPNWRGFVSKFNGEEDRVSVKTSKASIEGCVKRALLSSGGCLGIKIDFDTNNKQIEFSVQKVEESGLVQGKYSETEPLEEGQYSGELVQTVVISIDNLKDIISRSKSEIIDFRVKDSVSPVFILNTEEDFGYITSTIKYD